MKIYIIFLITIFLLKLIMYFKKIDKNQILFKLFNKKIDVDTFFLMICFLFLLIILVFRDYTVGIDLKNYLIRFLKIGNTPFNELWSLSQEYSFEYGFTFFNKIAYLLYPNVFTFMIFSSIFSLIGFFHFINRYSNNKIFSFFIFFTFAMATNSMNTIRQYISISILLYSIDFIIEHDFRKFLIFVILATTIHSSSIAFIIVYPIQNILNLNILQKKYILILLFLVVFSFLFGYEIIKFLMKYTSFSWYLNNLTGSGETMLIVLMTFFVGLEFVYISNKCNDNITNILMIMLGITILLNSLALHIGILERMMRTFIPAIIVLIPNSFYFIKTKSYILNSAKILVCSFFVFYFAYIMQSSSFSGGTNVYKFISPEKLNSDIQYIYETVYK